MKAYKVTVLVIDHDDLGADGIESEMESVSYPNDCVHANVMAVEEAEIGEWDDDHPLNSGRTLRAEFERLFPVGIPT